jgi:carbamoyltransferase
MNVLGIGGYSHDSAAALVVDGRLVAAVAEERLTRAKHQGGTPRRAAAWCLEHAGLTPDDVDIVAGYMRPGLRLARRVPYRIGQAFRSPKYAAAYIGYELVHNAQYAWGLRGLLGRGTRLRYMEHHPAHAASAFLVSPFDEAALLTVDYIGEWAVTWAGVGRGTSIKRLWSCNYPHSLGVFYSAITDYLGFRRASDEYKVMGLASYGEPAYHDDFARIVRGDGAGGCRVDLSWLQCHYAPGSRVGYFSKKFIDRFGPPRRRDEPVEERHRNIAASAQRVLEDTVLDMARALHKTTGLTRLCLAGGVALNCAMNGRLLREGPFDEIYVQPAAGDDGIAIGGAFQAYHDATGAPRSFVMEDARLGPEHGNDAIQSFLDLAKIPYEQLDDVPAATARLIADGLIVGWHQGRMEFGPRALGARSILADPTRHDMRDLINKYVKHREEFRPFAPSCLEEKAADYFEGCTRSPFMLFVHPVKPGQRDRVPAITHVDGTARVQTVSRSVNPRYHAMITAFEQLRGVPMVLNTSFNDNNEPIVNTPAEAVRCFYSTGMDALVIGDFLVRKR